ncbi:hypothetical protein CMT95_06200 [Elizabethkingia anophelis]|nr:hypothetical protein [Elizabethkingia anophelis]
METPSENQQEYRFSTDQINWEALSYFGLTKEKFQELNILETLLKGYKTNQLVSVKFNLGAVVTRLDARLSFQDNQDGETVLIMHGMRREPQLSLPFFSHEFTKEDKENLLSTGNMGRVVDLTNPKTGEKIPSIVSIDHLTNEIVAVRQELIKIPDVIKGVTLSTEDKELLKEGKSVYLEGMISNKGEAFDAFVQFNAEKKYVEFLFNQKNKLTSNVQKEEHSEAPRAFRGKELTKVQYNKLVEGETISLSGLIDRSGRQYSGELTFDKETKRTVFLFKNFKDQVKSQNSEKIQKPRGKKI